jgi:ATP phosphoribosyltransferase
MLTLALPKGRLLDPALEMLRELGVDGVDAESRKLIFCDEARGLRLLFLKPSDIPAYVTYGAADLGIVGKDILAEQAPGVDRSTQFRVCHGRRRAARAVGARRSVEVVVGAVATKYPRMTGAYFSERGIQVEIDVDGSIELAPLVGLADHRRPRATGGRCGPANRGYLALDGGGRQPPDGTEYAAVTGLIQSARADERREPRDVVGGASPRRRRTNRAMTVAC